MTRPEFQKRLAKAQKHERRVKASLELRGWLAELFGQGQLSEQMRDVIKRVKTPVRYMPDIIAAQKFNATTRIVFIDAKDGDKWQETENHDVEKAALDAAEQWEQMSGCAFYYVFADGGVATPEMVRATCTDGRFRGIGSGTPFVVFPRSVCTTFDATFGPAEQWATSAEQDGEAA